QGYPIYITFYSGITQKHNEAGKGKCGEGLKLICQREIFYGNTPLKVIDTECRITPPKST
ncbi:MAG: hypothetical protein ACE5H1_08615, partial [Thermodesulfobacteriota bacterium]